MEAVVISKSLDEDFDEEEEIATILLSYSIKNIKEDTEEVTEDFFTTKINMTVEEADKLPLGKKVTLSINV